MVLDESNKILVTYLDFRRRCGVSDFFYYDNHWQYTTYRGMS